jgi:DNA-binding NtrC family response regulator
LMTALLTSQIARAAASDGPLLIIGEPGTGRSLAAELVHHQDRRGGFFVGVHCAAIPASLLEAQLFGHVCGAFPGVHVGTLESARLGTALLMDVETLPIDIQQLLLRFVLTGEMRYVGSAEWFRPPPVRVIAATACDLRDEVSAGRFHKDLGALLQRNSIVLPPLRQRPDDILPIFQYYLDVFSQATGRTVPDLGSTTIDRLRTHQWPGNVRELVQTAARVAISGDTALALEPVADSRADWRELVEVQWRDTIGRDPADVVTCGIYFTDAGLELHLDSTSRKISTVAEGRQLAREWRREFLFRGRRYQDLVQEERENG